MMNKQNLKGHIRQIMLAGVLTGAAGSAWATDLNLTDNQISISGEGTFAVDRTEAGKVADISVETGSVSQLPSLTFSLEDNVGAVGSETTYRVRLFIVIQDDPAGTRRIESKLGDVDVTVNGNSVSVAEVPSAEQEIIVYAEDAGGTNVTVNSQSYLGLLSINGSAITINPANFSTVSDESLIDDVLASLALTGDYQYEIYAREVTDNGFALGHYDSSETAGSEFQEFDPASTDLTAGTGIDTSYSDASGAAFELYGAISFVEPSSGDGGDDEDEETPQQPAEEASEVAKNVTEAIRNGASGPEVARTALETINNSFAEAGESNDRGAGARQTLRDTGALLGAVAARGGELNGEQRAGIGTQVKQIVQSSQRLIADDASEDELTDIASSISDILSNTSAAGVELDGEFETQARGLAKKAATVQLRRKLGANLPDTTELGDPSELREVLLSNPDARDSILDVLPQIRSRLTSSLGASVQNPKGITIGGRTALQTLESALGVGGNATGDTEELSFGAGTSVQAASHDELGVVVDDATGVVTITLASEVYTGVLLSSKVAPEGMPEELAFRRNGTATVGDNGLVLEVAPVAANMEAFNSAVADAGFSSSVRDNGSIEIDLGNGEIFSGAFAYNNQAGADGECGAVSIVEPSGAANAAGHAFGVNCDNGVEQDVVPFPNSQAFFRAVVASDLTVSADRNTGIITIDGEQRFKPSFYVSPLTAEDVTFREENAVEGVAFQAVDVNGDGLMDYQVMFENGVQVFYGTP